MKNNIVKRKIAAVVLAFVASLCLLCAATTKVNAAGTTEIAITVDAGGRNAFDLPDGVVGKTYPVFEYSATINGGTEVEDVEIFVQDPDSKYVKIVDDRFATDKVGEYTVTYVATYGNAYETYQYNVNVIAESDYSAPYYDFGDAIASSGKTGYKIAVPDGEVKGGLEKDKITSAIKIVYRGEYENVKTEISDFGEGKFFTPEASGTYVVTCELTDVLGDVAPSTHEITVTDSKTPITDEPSFALIGHVGEKMTFPTVNSKLYVSGKVVYMPVKVYFGDTDITSDMSFTPEKAGDFTVKYQSDNVFDSSAQPCVKTYTVKVVDTTKKSTYATRFMYTDGFVGEYRTGHESLENRVYVLTADGSQTSATMQFKTPVYTQFLKIKAGTEQTLNNFTQLNVSFVDSIDGNQRVNLTFKANSEGTVDAYINGKYSSTLGLSFNVNDTSKKSTFELSFDSSDNSVYEATSKQTVGIIKTYANGDGFKGFSSDRAYISVGYEGISAECQLKIYEIAGQKITSSMTDNSSPLIVSGGYTDSSIFELGATVVLPDFTVFDLYDTDVTLSVTITATSGSPVSTNKTADGFELTLNEYGKYNVHFTAKDSSGNSTTKKTVIYVYDRTAPSITAPKLPSTVKVGEKLSLPAATIVDNVSEECTVWIYVTDEDFYRTTVENNEYTFTKAGTYLVKYGAMDEDGNLTVVEYTIICK